MKFFFPGILIFGLYAFFARWYFVCEIQQLCQPVEEDVRSKTMQLSMSDTLLLDNFDEFRFEEEGLGLILNENNTLYLDSVLIFADLYQERNVRITGRYLVSERGKSMGIFENLGIARAAALELAMDSLGFDLDRVVIDYEELSSELLTAPLKVELSLPDNYQELQFTFTDMTFSDANFEFGSAEFEPGDAFKLYADSLLTYFDLYEDNTLSIVGHTDSIGELDDNLDLGQDRAESAKLYLSEMGLDSTLISISSMGESEPVAPNSLEDGSDNELGRQKNRRVNFIIKSKE